MKENTCTCPECQAARANGVSDVPNNNVALDARIIVFLTRRLHRAVADQKRANRRDSAAPTLYRAKERWELIEDVSEALDAIEREILKYAAKADAADQEDHTQEDQEDQAAQDTMASGLLDNPPTATRH